MYLNYPHKVEIGMSLESFERLADAFDLSNEERAVLIYRFGIGDGIVRTLVNVADILADRYGWAYDENDVLKIERETLRFIHGPTKGA